MISLAHPEIFAAIAPICGGGVSLKTSLSDPKKAAALKSLPVWAFHGAKDPVVKASSKAAPRHPVANRQSFDCFFGFPS